MNTRRRERQRIEYVTIKQKRKLIQLMSKHPQLISFRVSQGFNHSDSQQLWHNIAKELNSIPGSKKTWRQWRKTWQDIRSKVKKRHETNGEVPTYVTKLTAAEQEALGVKNVSSTTNCQESTEFVPLDMDNTQYSFDNDDDRDNGINNQSNSEPDSSPEEKVFPQSQKKEKKSKKDITTHTEGCIFNCEKLTEQEQKKLKIKEDYYRFKKDYFQQKLELLKIQSEALKNIAKKLARQNEL